MKPRDNYLRTKIRKKSLESIGKYLPQLKKKSMVKYGFGHFTFINYELVTYTMDEVNLIERISILIK